MHKVEINLKIVFLIALFGVLFFPHFHLLYFAPYLILAFYRYSRFAVLWRAIGCGIILDLFSSSPHFGMMSLNFCLVSWLLYGQNRNFFEDKPSTLPLMTVFFSSLSTLLSIILLFFFAQPLAVTFKWAFTDLICMPLLDGLYAFLLALPFHLAYKLRRIIRAKRRASR